MSKADRPTVNNDTDYDSEDSQAVKKKKQVENVPKGPEIPK